MARRRRQYRPDLADIRSNLRRGLYARQRSHHRKDGALRGHGRNGLVQRRPCRGQRGAGLADPAMADLDAGSAGYAGPIGLNGRYRLGEATALGVIALKGAWSNSQTFAIDVRLLGGDNDRKWILSFDGAKVNLRGKDADGREVSIDGEIAGSN